MKAYVILLRRVEERVRNVYNYLIQCHRDLIEWVVTDAVDGMTEDIDALLQSNGIELGQSFQFKRGQIGCWLSHYLVWKQIADSAEEYALVVEDDVVLHHSFASLREIMNNLPADCDILQLFTHPQQRNAQCRQGCRVVYECTDFDVRLWVAGYSWGTVGYVITREACQKLLREVRVLQGPIDMDLQKLRHVGALRFYATDPSLIECRGQTDHITNPDQAFQSTIWDSPHLVTKPRLLIGIGTSQRGTDLLHRLLQRQARTHSTLERDLMPWQPDVGKALQSLNQLRNEHCGPDCSTVCDIGFYWLSYVESILETYPDAKCIAITSDKETVVQRYIEATVGRNHWSLVLQDNEKCDDKWDRCFPKYDLPKELAVRQYYEEYNAAIRSLQEKYTSNRFRVFNEVDLLSGQASQQILHFCT